MLDSDRFLELKASGNLPSPKGVALTLMELCQRDNVTLPEIVQVLQIDPTMVGRILKLANSAAFCRPRPAVAMNLDVLMSIGIQSVRQVVLAFSLVSEYRNGHCPGFNYDLFWSRCAATGVAAQLLGDATRVAPPAELFTVGLLANIGRMALAALHADRYGELIAQSGGQFSPGLAILEQKAFGHDHLDVAAAMMRDWGLPKLFNDAVLFHEAPDTADFGIESRSGRLTHCLHLANKLAHFCFIPQPGRGMEFFELLPLARKLGIADDNLIALGDQMLREWKDWSTMLELGVREVPPFSALDVDAQVPDPAAAGMVKHLNILVVDDDPTVCLLLKRVLTSAGHTVHMADDGHQGLALALELQPHLVITDLMMGHHDGLRLIKALRQTEFGRAIYIMVLTILDDDDNLAEAFDCGADDYLIKPFESKPLLARFKAGMRMIREQQALRQEHADLQRCLLELSIANQRAQEAALTDVLTGLYNRRYAMRRLAQEWAEAERGHRSLCVLELDIDDFKSVNDQHGHDTGDAALRQFAEILRVHSRTPDVPCRFGGEEFLLIAPDTSLEGACNLAERIRLAVQDKPLAAAGISLRLTVSIGVAEKSTKHASIDQLINAADDALYRTKQNGRNRAEKAQP